MASIFNTKTIFAMRKQWGKIRYNLHVSFNTPLNNETANHFVLRQWGDRSAVVITFQSCSTELDCHEGVDFVLDVKNITFHLTSNEKLRWIEHESTKIVFLLLHLLQPRSGVKSGKIELISPQQPHLGPISIHLFRLRRSFHEEIRFDRAKVW